MIVRVEGDIAQLSLSELVQMFCMGMHDREVHVFDGNASVGVITLRRGQVTQCFAFGLSGERAFFRLLAMRAGRYVVHKLDAQSEAAGSLGQYTWQELLMEAARIQATTAY